MSRMARCARVRVAPVALTNSYCARRSDAGVLEAAHELADPPIRIGDLGIVGIREARDVASTARLVGGVRVEEVDPREERSARVRADPTDRVANDSFGGLLGVGERTVRAARREVIGIRVEALHQAATSIENRRSQKGSRCVASFAEHLREAFVRFVEKLAFVRTHAVPRRHRSREDRSMRRHGQRDGSGRVLEDDA